MRNALLTALAAKFTKLADESTKLAEKMKREAEAAAGTEEDRELARLFAACETSLRGVVTSMRDVAAYCDRRNEVP